MLYYIALIKLKIEFSNWINTLLQMIPYRIDANRRPAFYFRPRVSKWRYIQILYVLIKILPQKGDFWAKKWRFIQSGALIKSGVLFARIQYDLYFQTVCIIYVDLPVALIIF